MTNIHFFVFFFRSSIRVMLWSLIIIVMRSQYVSCQVEDIIRILYHHQKEMLENIGFIIFFCKFVFIVINYYNDKRWYCFVLKRTSVNCVFLCLFSFCDFVAFCGRIIVFSTLAFFILVFLDLILGLIS